MNVVPERIHFVRVNFAMHTMFVTIQDLPVVLGNVASVLHSAPLLPWLFRTVGSRVPDPLTPDDVLHVDRKSVV